jgi:hypothetical protein
MTKQEKTAVAFFYENAGYSYDPVKETQEQGRKRCARSLAKAEAWLTEQPHQIEWTEDPDADRSWMDETMGDDWPLFQCAVAIMGDNGDWKWSSLCGIDLGPTGMECREYMRVVVAELASELMV